MTSTTITPSIDDGALQTFRSNFHTLAQQTKSKVASSKAIVYVPSNGKTHNYPRLGRLELTEVNVRNPDKQYGDYNLDNRQFSKRRFTRTVQIDAKYDINELIKDPTSDIVLQLNNAKERVIDRVIVAAAVGSVLVGPSDSTPASVSASTDGVITVDATAGLTYEKSTEVTENFINNELEYEMIRGSIFCISGAENTDLMGEAEFISNDYMPSGAVSAGTITNAGVYGTALFAGSKTGGITVANPILPEVSTTRSCVVLAPESIALSMEIGDLSVTKSANKVNSWDITIDLWINAMRTEGVRVQIVSTTI